VDAVQPTERPDIEQRLSKMLQLPTVSALIDEPPSPIGGGMEPFESFKALLRELYPLVHERLELETFGELGLVFHWKGGGPDSGTGDADPSLPTGPAATLLRNASEPAGVGPNSGTATTSPGTASASPATTGAASGPAVLMAHWDVVPVDPSDAWTHPPFAGNIADGSVWGRGTLDDKGQLCVLLDAVENLLAAGFTPSRDIYLSLGGDEESHGAAAASIAEAFQARGIRPWIVLDEGGAVTDAPLPMIPLTSAMVGVAEKGILSIVLEARGDGGHASAPGAELATTRIARAVRRLAKRPFPAAMPRSARAMFASFAEHSTGRARTLTRALAAVPAVSAKVLARLGGEPAAMVRTTLAVTMLAGGTAANVLPSQASATLNLRLAPGSTVEQAIERVRRTIRDDKVSVHVLAASAPSPESAPHGPQWDLLRDAVTASYPEAVTIPYIQMSATDSRHFHPFSPATYRFAPFLMTQAQRDSIHGVDEWVTIDSLERGERFYRTLIRSL
jgi:carboxypeptidase PM20D1